MKKTSITAYCFNFLSLITGEFSRVALVHEGTEDEETVAQEKDATAHIQDVAPHHGGPSRHPPGEKLLGPASSIYTFTRNFVRVADYIEAALSGTAPSGKSIGDVISIDGGPHTFWW